MVRVSLAGLHILRERKMRNIKMRRRLKLFRQKKNPSRRDGFLLGCFGAPRL